MRRDGVMQRWTNEQDKRVAESLPTLSICPAPAVPSSHPAFVISISDFPNRQVNKPNQPNQPN